MADIKVVYIEDDELLRKSLHKYLSRRFTDVLSVGSCEEGLEIILKERPDVVVTDIEMAGMGGLVFIKTLNELASNTKIIATTAFPELLTDSEGVYRILQKPFSTKVLVHFIEEACK